MSQLYQKLFCFLALSSSLALSPIAEAESILLTDKSSGRSITAVIINSNKKNVTVRLESGRTHDLPLASLTEDSVKKIHTQLIKQRKSVAEAARSVNKAIGITIFGGAVPLWDEPVQTVAQRLSIKPESTVKTMRSYRLYTRGAGSFLGAHPYCLTLYGDPEENAAQISLVFANKGDYGSKFGLGPDHFKKVYDGKEPPQSLEKAIELDSETITHSLNQEFGEPETQYFGEKTDRRKVKRWDWNNHSFILSELDGEYVSLSIIPTTTADAEGKVARIRDSEMKKIKTKNVLKKTNGDVWIQNIPMVDQGPKGYCAPATMERAMRYMGVPADMYLLAVSATKPEEGTNMSLLKANCERIVRSKARRFKPVKFDREIKMKEVKKHINKGVPILWCMRSLTDYNKITNLTTKKRTKVNNWQEWAIKLQENADELAPGLEKIDKNHHICMIIGYNEATNELAVSDSWGVKYALRWVHIDIASAVSYGGSFVLSF